jgi:hypothetical protein
MPLDEERGQDYNMATSTFVAIATSSTGAIADYAGALWPVAVPVIIGITLAVGLVRFFRGKFHHRF